MSCPGHRRRPLNENLRNKRNISIIAHGGAGKTTLAEAMLYNAKAIDRLGRVDDGTSHMDFEPEEQKRKTSISASIHHYQWSDHNVNLMDTPGYSDFLGETRNTLRVSGGSVVILSAISGVKVQTQRVWGFADDFEVSRIAFVNKVDRERANFLRAVDDMEKVLRIKGIAMQMPIEEGPELKGLVDLIAMKAHIYRDSAGAYEVKDVHEALKKDALRMREAILEAIVETDDSLTERYLNGEEITEAELKGALREGVLTKRFVPVYLGSALKNIGVKELMDAINLWLPSPLERGNLRGSVKGVDTRNGAEAVRDVNGPFSAFVFKTMIDPYTGKLSVFRVYSGSVRADGTALNPANGVREKFSHLYMIEGKRLKEVSSAEAGDIVAAAKLKDTSTGDTLCDPTHPIRFPTLPRPNPALSYAIHPKTKADEDKAPSAIARLIEEDPSLEFKRDEQTKEFTLSGVGQVHLEVSVERLKRKFGCEVELKTPKVPYRETIRSHVRVQGRYKKQSGGRGQYGDAWLDISPLRRGGGFEFVDAVTGGVISRQFIPAVEKGVAEAMNSGVLAGFPVVDVKVTLYDGSYHSVDSSEMAFKIAGSMGFKKGMAEAHPVLLEPIMKMEINVPDDCLGNCIGDITSRRGKVLGAEPKAGSQTVKALVPLSEVIMYATDLKGITGDRGIFTMEFSHYEDVPSYLSQKIIAAHRVEEKEE